MDIIVKANQKEFEEAKGDMCKALEELMADVIEERVEEQVAKKQEELIKVLVADSIEDGKTKDVIIDKLVKIFSINKEEAKNYFEEFSR